MESYGGHLVEWLHRGEMDLAIIYGPAVDLHLQVQSIGREDIAVVGPPGSGLNKRKQVDLKWLVKQKLILPEHLAWPARAAGEGRRARAIEAQATDRSRFLPRPDQPDGARPRLHAVAAVRDPGRTGGEALEMAALVSPSVSRELILASPIAHPSSIATTTIATLIMSEIQQLSKEGLWKINMTA